MFSRSNAQDDIETLAERTHGKSYFVADNTGPDEINDAISGASEYLPDTKSSEQEILVMQESFTNKDKVQTDFFLDKFLGGDLKIQVDVSPKYTDQKLGTILVTKDGATFISEDLVIDSNSVYQYHGEADTNEGSFEVTLELNKKIDFLSVRVASKPPSDTAPLRSRCWTSAGSQTLSMSDDFLAVFAEVKQGNNPVIGASVRAIIEREGANPINVELHDSGSQPDIISNDGIYSRFITK